jgi:hypothetical protein
MLIVSTPPVDAIGLGHSWHKVSSVMRTARVHVDRVQYEISCACSIGRLMDVGVANLEGGARLSRPCLIRSAGAHRHDSRLEEATGLSAAQRTRHSSLNGCLQYKCAADTLT